jgi:hypothetical protein
MPSHVLDEKWPVRKTLRALLSVTATYLVIYAAASVSGAYQPSISGTLRYPEGMAVMDCHKWQPRFLVFELYQDIEGTLRMRKHNFLGLLFAPLILLDRSLVHPTIAVFDTQASSPRQP